ncbi:MAG: Dps family protein [Enterococcus sp.]
MKFSQTKEVLNQLVADLSQMSMVIHQTHWYMRGPGFLTLHPMMDTFMDDIDEQLDEVSERLITLDGSPYSTLKELAEQTKIEDEVGRWDRTMTERLENLVKGYRYLADLYQKGIDVSGEEGDDPTQDMFIEFKTATEKRIWMLQAHLGKAPEIDA